MSVQTLERCGPAASWSFGRFAGVGLIGWVVQMAMFFALTSVGVHQLIAIALAVELTILHNFTWHELYTWRDARSTSRTALALRLLRFNSSTAIVSILGNVILTALIMERFHLPVPVANAVSVSALSILNYAVANRWIFAHR
jgi:putative flippase GtrA